MAAMFSSARAAVDALASGAVTTEDLAAQCLKRIGSDNPRINAVSDVLADSALEAARKIDARRKAGAPVGPLQGLPVLVKDLIDVAGAHGRAGLDFLADYVASEDAELVARLRAADAVIVGVTETDSGAFLVTTPQTTHPHAPGRVVGGSSGGSAAAVAAGFGLAAIGTDTGGSIRIPAACCSLAGLKPTTGRVPLDGVRPLAWSLDHAGPIMPTADDLPLLAGVLDRTFDATGPTGPARRRVGYDPAYYRDAVDAVKADMERTLELFREAGFGLARIKLPDPDQVLDMHMVNLPAEAAAYHFEVFPDRYDDYPPGVRVALDIARRTPAYLYVQAERWRRTLRGEVDAALSTVDAVIAPTLPVLPPQAGEEMVETGAGTHPVLQTLIRYTCLFNQSGHPSTSVPVSRDADGIGTSIQIVAARNRDRVAVELASFFEACRGPL